MNHHKRGFTLTELLIVVIVIGILSAVVLPRYNKTIETRKTTEAEDILSAIRTEQERRCTLGEKYVTDIASLSEIVPNTTTDNFLYSLSENGGGTLASSLGSYSYTLQMPSYADGRICCEGEECSKLNKDYPTCEELTQSTDFKEAAECLSSNPVNPIDPLPFNPRPYVIKCFGPSSQNCGCNNQGTQTRTCGEDGWSAWGECSVGSACCGTAGAVETKSCNTSWTLPMGSCYGQTRVCQDNGTWSDWSGCQNYACAAAETLALEEIACKQLSKTISCGCAGNGHKTRTCGKNGWSEWSACDKPETGCCSLNPADWGTQDLDLPFDPLTRTTCHVDGHPADKMCGTQTRECLASTLTYSDWGTCQPDPSTMCGGGAESSDPSNPGISGGGGGYGSGGNNGNNCTQVQCCCRTGSGMASLPKQPKERFSFYYAGSIGGGGAGQAVIIDDGGGSVVNSASVCGGIYTNPVGAIGYCNAGVWISQCGTHRCGTSGPANGD